MASTSAAPNTFATDNLQAPNHAYQQGQSGCFPELDFDPNSAINPYTTVIESGKPNATTTTSAQRRIEAQHHEPRARIPSAVQKLLEAYFDLNYYPTPEDKKSIAVLTKLTVSQVSTWFNNKRHRGAPQSALSFSTPTVQESPNTGRYQDHQRYPHYSARNGSRCTPFNTEASSNATYLPGPEGSVGDYGMQSPSLQAYQNTPPRDDAQPVIVSANVVGFQTKRTSQPISEVTPHIGQYNGSSGSWARIPPNADGHHSFDLSRESTQMSSVSSVNRMASVSEPRRQGKRKMCHPTAFPRNREDPLKIYQCVRCFEPFKTSSDMRRHIETQHDRQKIYICMREGLDGLRILNNSSRSICILCHFLEPGDDHFYESHNVGPCIQKDPKHSFNRKDQLSRHIKDFHDKGRHGLEGRLDVLKRWETPLYDPGTEASQYCGFCQSQRVGWQMFINHISKHFVEGSDMTMWVDSLESRNQHPYV